MGGDLPCRAHAATASWVAVVLNVIPGLVGRLPVSAPRRAYWITSAVATAWFVVDAVLAQKAAAAEARNELVGLIDLLVLAAATASEEGLAGKRVLEGS
jgi:hypothetical protein